MDNLSNAELEAQNENSYDDLIVSIEASEDRLSLLIAVCDDLNFRDQIIDRYEAELQPQIKTYRVKIDRGEPSLKAAIAHLIETDEYLQQGNPAVITVTGTEEFYFLKLGEARSEQEIFFGYLQWTREALRQFPYPIVLWVNNYLKNSIIKKAPDFWSWRKGVFTFNPINDVYYIGLDRSGSLVTYTQNSQKNIALIPWNQKNFSTPILNNQNVQLFFKLAELEELINQAETDEKIQEESKNKNVLIVLYEMAGQTYRERLKNSDLKHYKAEQDLAIQHFQKAIALRRELNLRNGLDKTLAHLGSLHEAQGDYDQAEKLYREALDILEEQGNYADAITRLNNLAGIYHIRGQYEEAIKLYNQSLEIYAEGKDKDTATYAATINLLAGTYHAQENYLEAEKLYQKSLEIRLKEFGESHPDVAVSLNNLGLLYAEQNQFSTAESYYKQSLAIQKQLFGDTNPDIATSFNNLALLYYSQGRFQEAESNLIEALELRKKLLGNDHADVAGSLNNLAGLYKAQGRFQEAEPLLAQAVEIAINKLGNDHPITQRFQKSLDHLKSELS